MAAAQVHALNTHSTACCTEAVTTVLVHQPEIQSTMNTSCHIASCRIPYLFSFFVHGQSDYSLRSQSHTACMVVMFYWAAAHTGYPSYFNLNRWPSSQQLHTVEVVHRSTNSHLSFQFCPGSIVICFTVFFFFFCNNTWHQPQSCSEWHYLTVWSAITIILAVLF